MMKYLKLEREEYLYLLLALQRNQEEILRNGDHPDDAHVKKVCDGLLLKMKTPTPSAKLCVIHGDGQLDMEKDAECIVCERDSSEASPCEPDVDWGCEARKKLGIARGALYGAKEAIEGMQLVRPGEAREPIEAIDAAIAETAQPQPCAPRSGDDPRDRQLSAADMEVMYATGTPRPHDEPSAESLAEMPEITDEQWKTARRRHPK